MKKKTISLAVSFLLFGLTIGVFATNKVISEKVLIYKGIQVVIDGEILNPTDVKGTKVPIFTLNGTTYLPVRAISNVFKKKIEWDGKTRTVYLGERKGSKTSTKLSTYYMSSEGEAPDKWEFLPEYKDINGNLRKNVVKFLLSEDAGGAENPEPYGYSPATYSSILEPGIILDGKFTRFTAEYIPPIEAKDAEYYDKDESAKKNIDTYSSPSTIEIEAYYLSGDAENKIIFKKSIKKGDKSIKIDLDITNVKSLKFNVNSGQSHNGKAAQGMLVDPKFHK